jgi:hypothetical protein
VERGFSDWSRGWESCEPAVTCEGLGEPALAEPRPGQLPLGLATISAKSRVAVEQSLPIRADRRRARRTAAPVCVPDLLRNVRTLRRLRLIDSDCGVGRPGRKRIERPQHERR